MRFIKAWQGTYPMIILLALLGSMFPQTGAAAPQGETVVLIDAAHGGDDPGVVADKVREKDLTMGIAMLIRQEALKKPGLNVQLIRTADRGMTIAERIKAAGTVKADCLLSLHVNAGFGKKATGYEIYYPGLRPAASGDGKSAPIIQDMLRTKSLNDSVRLAQRIQSGLETVSPRKGRGLREAPNPLLDGLAIPGLVVEMGFATQPEERKKLADPEVQRGIARAVVDGLRNYLSEAR